MKLMSLQLICGHGESMAKNLSRAPLSQGKILLLLLWFYNFITKWYFSSNPNPIRKTNFKCCTRIVSIKRWKNKLWLDFVFFKSKFKFNVQKQKQYFQILQRKDRRWRIEQIFDVFLQFPNLMWENIFKF